NNAASRAAPEKRPQTRLGTSAEKTSAENRKSEGCGQGHRRVRKERGTPIEGGNSTDEADDRQKGNAQRRNYEKIVAPASILWPAAVRDKGEAVKEKINSS